MKSTDYYDERRGIGADKLKIALMPFVCFAAFGFPSAIGSYVKVLSGFAAPAFFILCGFFMFESDEAGKLSAMKRGMKRSAVKFAILFVLFLAVNAAYYFFINGINVVPTLLTKRKLFEIFVLTYWPFDMGITIWFIQSLLYAYIFFFILQKIKLFKYYKIIMAVFIIGSIALGEFAAVLHFNFLGYNYIPVGFFTIAVPFMLIGVLMREKIKIIFRIHPLIYIFAFIAGLAIAFFEMEMLGRLELLANTGQSIGLGISAIAVCCFALQNTDSNQTFFSAHGSNYAKRIYMLCEPVAFALIVPAQLFVSAKIFVVAKEFSGVLIFAICFALAVIIGFIKSLIIGRKRLGKSQSEDGTDGGTENETQV